MIRLIALLVFFLLWLGPAASAQIREAQDIFAQENTNRLVMQVEAAIARSASRLRDHSA